MKRQITWMMLAVFLGFITAGSIYAADQPSSASPPGQIPQTGGEELAKKDAEVLRGKLLRIEDRLYTVETGPGRQVDIRTGKATKFEGGYQGVQGDWIEAVVTPDMHIDSIKKSTPAYTVEGDVLKVEGDFFVVKDTAGKEIKLQIDKNTQMIGTHKVGQRVRAEYTPDGQALSIKPIKITRGPPGD